MKLCRNCKFCVPRSVPLGFVIVNDWHSSKCASPALLSPVTGQAHELCEFMRKENFSCGPEAVLFEERPPVPRTWLDKFFGD